MDQYRHIGLLAQAAQQFETVGIGQAKVKNHDIRTFAHLSPHRGSGFGKQTLDSGARQRSGENMARCRIVFNYECNLAHGVRKGLKNGKIKMPQGFNVYFCYFTSLAEVLIQEISP